MREFTERLLFAVASQSREGAPVFTRDEVESVIPLLWALSGDKRDALLQQPSVAKVMARFVEKLGLDGRTTPEEASTRIASHFADNPPAPHLMQLLERLVGEFEKRGIEIPAGALEQVGALSSNRPVGSHSTPEGAQKASPLSRFTLEPKANRKK